MNCAQNCLSARCKFAKKTYNVECGLSIETRGRFVQKRRVEGFAANSTLFEKNVTRGVA